MRYTLVIEAPDLDRLVEISKTLVPNLIRDFYLDQLEPNDSVSFGTGIRGEAVKLEVSE